MTSPLPPSRLAALPGYDTAPDIYETADTTDTTTSTQRSPSASPEPSELSDTSHELSDSASDAESGAGGVVSRRRFNIGRARRRFDGEGKGVRVKGVDLSDRVDAGGRRGYGLRYRSREGREDEGLGERVARLRREVEECRVLAEREGEGGEGVGGLEDLLRGLVVDGTDRRKRGGKEVRDQGKEEEDPDLTEEQMVGKVADFDTRLASLETALGLSALDSATQTDATAAMPLLPSLTVLDQQLAALSSASSVANIEAASARIQKLRAEADAALTRSATTANDEDEESDQEITAISSADLQQLSQLYTLLPTLQSLSPTVPALLSRLRSLRTLHTSASSAAQVLEDVERSQGEMERELKQWREGLGKVEQAVSQAQEANGRNGKVVEGWVRGLEGRVSSLGR
ncbi:uncharacterized protein LTR77_003999 [Saxophila tyrrhenica]|uniref:Uncharacterized protein n=1 Tax=Saxophila tyrrhenica TaxID=1690608 RepID=A0AAV9PFW3_9PEZI|nr:hypothetical protein LTR77_003999 [Saxophila tyrrhenica]